jgi:hypothetical protein
MRDCIRVHGAPRFLVTDHGCQFRTRFKRALKRNGIDLIKGRKDSKQFNGKVERFFRTFKLWQRLTLFAWKTTRLQRKLDVYREWYNDRPMWVLNGRTPGEAWSNAAVVLATPVRENDPIKPAVSVERINFRDDVHLPKLNIQIIRTVKRVA